MFFFQSPKIGIKNLSVMQVETYEPQIMQKQSIDNHYFSSCICGRIIYICLLNTRHEFLVFTSVHLFVHDENLLKISILAMKFIAYRNGLIIKNGFSPIYPWLILFHEWLEEKIELSNAMKSHFILYLFTCWKNSNFLYCVFVWHFDTQVMIPWK